MQNKNLMNNWNQSLLYKALYKALCGAALFALMFMPYAQAQEEAADTAAETEVMVVEEVIEEVVEAPAPAATLERMASSNTLKIGYYSDAGPFSFSSDSGQPAGYTVALCELVVEGIKSQTGQQSLQAEWVQVSPEGGLAAIADGSIDLLCGPTVATLGHRETVAFSIPVFPSGIGALIRSDAPDRLRLVLQGQSAPNQPLWRGTPASALQHRNFSAMAGTHAEAWLNERIKTFKLLATVAPVANYAAGVERILTRQSDVLFGDRAILSDVAQNSPSASQLMVLDRLFTLEPIALALPRGDEDFRLSVDRALSGVYGSDEFAELFTTYFGEPNEKVLLFFLSNTQPE